MTKVALITGASRGLGHSLALALAPTHHIVAVAKTVGALEELDDQIKAKGGAATLALRTGASIVPVTVYHQGAQNHAIVEPPIAVERQGKMRHDIERITQNMADVMEMQIRRAPTQWIVLQPNWPSDHQALRELRASR